MIGDRYLIPAGPARLGWQVWIPVLAVLILVWANGTLPG